MRIKEPRKFRISFTVRESSAKIFKELAEKYYGRTINQFSQMILERQMLTEILKAKRMKTIEQREAKLQ